MNKKKFLVIGLLGLFMISMFAGIVSAETVWERITSGAGEVMSDAMKGLVSKWLLIALVVLLVYAIAEALPFMKGKDKEMVRWGFSIIVGILSFMFVSTEMIMTILTTYEALGVALTSIIPLVILMVFMWQLREEHAAIAGVIEKPLYVLFAAYLIYKWVFTLEENALQYIYLITAIVTLGWMAFENKIWDRFKKEKEKEQKEKVGETLSKSVDYSKMTAEAYDKMSKKDQDAYKAGFP